MNEAFAAATRSTAFSLSLSSHMIDSLLWGHAAQVADDKHADLKSRFPWIGAGNWLRWFGQATIDGAVREASQSERALLRRGLIHFVEHPETMEGQTRVFDPNRHAVWQPRPTRAGMILSELLLEAGFTRTGRAPQPRVGLHPDDRPVIHLDGRPEAILEHRRDRRLDLMIPGDEAYFDPPVRTVRENQT